MRKITEFTINPGRFYFVLRSSSEIDSKHGSSIGVDLISCRTVSDLPVCRSNGVYLSNRLNRISQTSLVKNLPNKWATTFWEAQRMRSIKGTRTPLLRLTFTFSWSRLECPTFHCNITRDDWNTGDEFDLFRQKQLDQTVTFLSENLLGLNEPFYFHSKVWS